jgi:protein O-mannosyl-transferase
MSKKSPKLPTQAEVKSTLNIDHVESSTTWYDRLPAWAWAMIMAICAIGLYSNTLSHGFTVDDDLVIVTNKMFHKDKTELSKIWSSTYLQGFSGKKDAGYRPLSQSLLAIEYDTYNGKAGGMHMRHVLYYALGIFFTFLASDRLFKGDRILAIVCTLLFLAHPIHTEVVNNLKSRDEILALIGIMAMTWTYLKYLETEKSTWMIASITAYLIALFSKEASVAYFLIIPALYIWYHRSWSKSALYHTVPMMLVAIFFIMVRQAIVQGTPMEIDYLNNALAADSSWIARLPNALMLLGKYMYQIVVPYPLSLDYSFDAIPLKGWSSVYTYISLLALGGWLYMGYHGWKNKNQSLLIATWFLATIIVTSNVFFLIGSTYAERFAFVPSYAFALGAAVVCKRWISSSMITLILGVGLTMVYSMWTHQRNTHWVDDLTLFTHDAAVMPRSARIQTFYGHFLYKAFAESKDSIAQKNAFIQADTAIRKAIKIAPDFWLSHYHLGLLSMQRKDYKTAETHLGEVYKKVPQFKVNAIQYANAMAYNLKHVEAIDIYQKLYTAGEKDYTILQNLGFNYFKAGDYKNAEKFLLSAYQLDPQKEATLNYLIKTYRDGLNDMPNAVKYNDLYRQLTGK